MSKNRVLLSVFTVVAVVSMASEAATAQLFSGRLLGRRNAACCAPAPAPTCCGAVAPALAPAPCCGTPAPAPATCCGGVAAAPAPAAAPVMAAPMMSTPIISAPVSNCCGGGMVAAPVMGTQIMGAPLQGTVMNVETLPVEGVVSGETILETGETVQASPSDSTVTSDVVEPPAAADSTEVAPEEEN